MNPARRLQRLAVAVTVMSLFAATAGVALGTWSASASQSVGYTSWGPLNAPTGVSLYELELLGRGGHAARHLSVPAGSGGDSTEAQFSTTGSGGSYSGQGHVLLTDLSMNLSVPANTRSMGEGAQLHWLRGRPHERVLDAGQHHDAQLLSTPV